MLSSSFTKAELRMNQLKHKQLPPQIDFAVLKNNTLKLVHYLIQHEERLPHQKHYSRPILADYGTDHFSIRIIDEVNFKQRLKHPLKRTINHSINNIFHSMILMLQVITKKIYILKFPSQLHFHPR